MQLALIAKIFGWAQFLVPVLSQAATGGSPHGFAGWATLVGSLLGAVGIHAASSTEGTK
jgi:hypothetical protein